MNSRWFYYCILLALAAAGIARADSEASDIVPSDVQTAELRAVSRQPSRLAPRANSIKIESVDLSSLVRIQIQKDYFALHPGYLYVRIGTPDGPVLTKITLHLKQKGWGWVQADLTTHEPEHPGPVDLFLTYDGATARKGNPGSAGIKDIRLTLSSAKPSFFATARRYADAQTDAPQVLRAFYSLQESLHRMMLTQPDADAFWTWIKTSPSAYAGLMSGHAHTPGLTSPTTVRTAYDMWKWDTERIGSPEYVVGFAYGANEIGTLGRTNGLAMYQWYVRNKQYMQFPLFEAPWPLVMHVASNNTPIRERDWFIEHYKQTIPDVKQWGNRVRAAYDHLPYKGSSKNAPRFKDWPVRASELLKQGYSRGSLPVYHYHFGNVCAHKSWYAFRMMPIFGSPSFRFSERNHAYPVDIYYTNGRYVYHPQHSYGRVAGRNDAGGMKRVRYPAYDIQLLTQAMNKNPDGYGAALGYAKAYHRIPASLRTRCAGLLLAGARENHACQIAYDYLTRNLQHLSADDVAAYTAESSNTFRGGAYVHRQHEWIARVHSGLLTTIKSLPEAKDIKQQLTPVVASHPLVRSRLVNLDGQWIEKHGKPNEAITHYMSELDRIATLDTLPIDAARQATRATALLRARGDEQAVARYLGVLLAKTDPYPAGVRSDVDIAAGKGEGITWRKRIYPGKFPATAQVWHRKIVTIPAEWEGRDLVVSLGPIDRHDNTYYNGKRIGQAFDARIFRKYTVPAAVVRGGKAVIYVKGYGDVNVRPHRPHLSGKGGFKAQPEQMFVLPATPKPGETPIPLAGEWEYWILSVNPQFAHVGNLLVDSLKRSGRAPEATALSKKIAGLRVVAQAAVVEDVRAEGNADDPAYQAWLRELKTNPTLKEQP